MQMLYMSVKCMVSQTKEVLLKLERKISYLNVYLVYTFAYSFLQMCLI